MNFEVTTFINIAIQGYGSNAQTEDVAQVIREGWAWLEGQALLLPDPRQLHGNNRILSRKGRRLGGDARERQAFSSYRLPKDALHPTIREDVWALYQRGKYDTAIFEAMKAVEVAVRDAAGLQPTDIGSDLMRKAFHPNNGPLSDTAVVPSEREALSALFAGAIGAYKNPHSHRRVALDDPNEAAEIILLANHLLRIVEARKP
jgi:uncharacterized protein (TIGR02391 family)